MMMQKKNSTSIFKRPQYALAAVLLIVATLIPVIQNARVHAYGLLIPREIKISNSARGDDPNGMGNHVAYAVKFTLATGQDLQSIKIDFCQNSPIIGNSTDAPCATPNDWGFDTNKATLNVTNDNPADVDGTLAIDTSNSTTNSVVVTRTGGSGAIAAGKVVAFTLGDGTTTGLKNPVDACPDSLTTACPTPANTGPQVGTFYGRIRTFETANATGTEVDAGGIALSTATSLTITAKVTERLQFCVYTGAVCASGVSNSSITLGDANGVLDTNGTYVNRQTKYDILTNASQDVRVRIKGDTLKTGTFDILPIGPTATQVSGLAHVGHEQFGFCTFLSSGDTSLRAYPPYGGESDGSDDSGSGPASGTSCKNTAQTSGSNTPGGDNNAYYAFDTSTAVTGSIDPADKDDENITGPYGDTFAIKKAGGVSTGVLVFAANIANTTEAGIYNTTLYFIATGSF